MPRSRFTYESEGKVWKCGIRATVSRVRIPSLFVNERLQSDRPLLFAISAQRLPVEQPPFKTLREVRRYFSGQTIKCLLCGRRFGRLSFHLAAKHDMSTDDYKSRLGLPWHRGLTSQLSHANSGWDDARKAKASKLARKTRFFTLAHPTPRRKTALFLRAEAIRNLGSHTRASVSDLKSVCVLCLHGVVQMLPFRKHSTLIG
jgi:predicted transcriptional regulator